MHAINSFLNGAIAMASLAIAYFFQRFHKSTRDRLFGYFAAAFLLLSIERVGIAFTAEENRAGLYFIRLCAFALIMFAILEKNRKQRKQ